MHASTPSLQESAIVAREFLTLKSQYLQLRSDLATEKAVCPPTSPARMPTPPPPSSLFSSPPSPCPIINAPTLQPPSPRTYDDSCSR